MPARRFRPKLTHQITSQDAGNETDRHSLALYSGVDHRTPMPDFVSED